MTYRELFEVLLTKGYQPRPCGDHLEGPYCCARAVLDDAELSEEDPAFVEEMLRDFLTLDAREVYRVWYADQDSAWIIQNPEVKALKPLRPSYAALTDAFFAYRNGKAEGMLDFLLQNP